MNTLLVHYWDNEHFAGTLLGTMNTLLVHYWDNEHFAGTLLGQ